MIARPTQESNWTELAYTHLHAACDATAGALCLREPLQRGALVLAKRGHPAVLVPQTTIQRSAVP